MITVIEIGQVIRVYRFTIVIICKLLSICVLNLNMRALMLRVGKRILKIGHCVAHLLIFMIHK